MAWHFVGACYDGHDFFIDGLNVWQHKWTHDFAEKVEVIDPLYGQTFRFTLWEIKSGNKSIRFAAGEFSACVWGFYQEAERAARS